MEHAITPSFPVAALSGIYFVKPFVFIAFKAPIRTLVAWDGARRETDKIPLDARVHDTFASMVRSHRTAFVDPPAGFALEDGFSFGFRFAHALDFHRRFYKDPTLVEDGSFVATPVLVGH